MAGERGSAVVSAGTAVVMMLSMSMLFHCHVADAKQHTIDPWTIKSSDLTYYTKTWAANEKFTVRDTLVFKFDKSKHNVVEVDQTGYNNCTTHGAKQTIISSGGTVSVSLNQVEERFFICSVPGHCGLGMKLQITVS